MREGKRGFLNETTSYGIRTGSFPHYKQITMPADQKAKLLAMHRASRANAGIYVAVVLGVYVILLTMLLCRYTKRQRPSDPNLIDPGDRGLRPSSLPSISAPVKINRGFISSLCCTFNSNNSRGSDDLGHEEIQDITELRVLTAGGNQNILILQPPTSFSFAAFATIWDKEGQGVVKISPVSV